MFKFVAVGAGLAVMLGLGSVLLSFVGNANWGIFLMAAIGIFIIGTLVKMI